MKVPAPPKIIFRQYIPWLVIDKWIAICGISGGAGFVSYIYLVIIWGIVLVQYDTWRENRKPRR